MVGATLGRATPPGETVPQATHIRFIPATSSGTVSLGIYDQDAALVRVLCDEWPFSRFRIGLNGLSTDWDGHDDAGQPVAAGTYTARGFVVGDIAISGEAFHFNDWIERADSPRIVSVGATQLLPGGDILLMARLAGARGLLVRYSPESEARWRTVVTGPRPEAARAVQLAVGKTVAFALLDGKLRAAGLADGVEVPLPLKRDEVVAVAARGDRLALLEGARCASTFCPPSLHKVKRPTFPRRLPRWPCSTKVPWRQVRMARFGAGKRAGRNLRCRRRPKYGPFQPDGKILSGSSRNASMARPGWRITTRKKDVWPNGVRRPMGKDHLARRGDGAGLFRRHPGCAGRPAHRGDPATGRWRGWEYVFDKKITDSSGFGWRDGSLVASGGETPAEVAVRLVENPLDPGASRQLVLRARPHPTGPVLETTDGLPLLRVSTGTGDKRVILVPGANENTARFFQGDGSCVEEYALSNLGDITSFDAGTITMSGSHEALAPPLEEEASE